MDAWTRTLFAIVAYNCGPARVAQFRREGKRLGLNPNEWFGHVERVAAAPIGPETVRYVANVSKYYFAYAANAASLPEP
jgi:membrane-bound lytic murein transglycosylase MltF